MGSFSSKARAIQDGSRNFGDLPKGEINRGVEEEILSITDHNAIEENSTTQEQADGTNRGGSSCVDTGNHTALRIRQSFSWLASPPVVLNATANVHKRKRKSFFEGGTSSSNVMIYSNGKYLKSWQHPAEFPPSSDTTELKSQRSADSSSSLTADNKGNFAANEDHDKKGNKEQNANQTRPVQGNDSDFLSSRTGFGLLPQQHS